MKLQDPTAQFGDVIGKIRRERAASDLDCFRLDGARPNRDPRPSNGPIAVLGASAWALDPVRAELTSAYLGALGGLLADFGYDVFAIASVPRLDAEPAFVGWVGGQETPNELAQLARFGSGLSLSSGGAQVEAWRHIEPEGQPTDIDFIRTAFDEIRCLTGSDGAHTDDVSADPSTPFSTLRSGTGSHRVGRPGSADARSPSSRAQSGTGRGRTNKRSSGS